MANEYVDFPDQQPSTTDDEELKKSSLYQSNQRLNIENISSQSDVHGGGSNILIKEEHNSAESLNVQLPESHDIKAQEVLKSGEIPVANPSMPDNIQNQVQVAAEHGATQAADTHIPGHTIRGPDYRLPEITVNHVGLHSQTHAIEQPPAHKQEVLTQVKEVAVDIYQSPTISIYGPTAISTHEDTSFGLGLSYNYSSKLPVTGIEAIIRGLPSDFVVVETIGTATTVLAANPDGSYTIGADILGNISVIPPHYYSGEVQFQASVMGVTQDGIVLTSTSLPITTTVIAVANQPVITTANITALEGGAPALTSAFTATSPDAIGVGPYGSEVITAVIEGVPSDVKLYYAGSPGTYLSQDANGNWIVDPSQLSLVRFDTPADYKGIISATLLVTSTEPSDGSTNSASQAFTVTVDPVANGFASSTITGLTGNENTTISTPTSDNTVTLTLNDPTETVHATLSNIPAGVIITAPDGSVYTSTGTSETFDVSTWGHLVTVGSTTEWVLGAISVTPPHNSEADLSLQVTAFTIDSGANMTVTSTPVTYTVPVTVLAVAQPVEVNTLSNIAANTNGSWTYTITENQGNSETAAFHLALTDTSGSEALSSTLTGIPTGTVIEQVDSSGHILATNNGVETSLVLSIPSDGNIYLKVITPTNSIDNFTLNLNAQSSVLNTDPSQVAVQYNETNIPIHVDVTPQAYPADITVALNSTEYTTNFSTQIAENTIGSSYAPIAFAFTANSYGLTTATSTSGLDTISAVTITGLPAGTIIESSYITGGSYTTTTSGDIVTFNIPAGQTSISGTYSIIPPVNYVSTISAVLSVQTLESANNDTALSTITENLNIGHTVTDPSMLVQATYTIHEDPTSGGAFPSEMITYNTNSTITNHLTVTLSGLVPDSIIQSVASPTTHLVVAADGTVTLTDQNWPDFINNAGHIIDNGTINFQIIPPTNYDSSAVSTIGVTTTAYEGSSSASTTGSFNFVVTPVADPLNNPTALATSIINDPGSYSTLTLTLPLTDTDGSESITSAILQSIPNGYSIKVEDSSGIWHDATLVPDGSGHNTVNLLSYGDLIGNNIYVQIFPDSNASGTVSLSTVVVNTDTGITSTGAPTTDTHTTTLPVSFTVYQDAIATQTSVSGIGDNPILVDLGLSLSGPSESFAQLDITGGAGSYYVENGTTTTTVVNGDLLAAGWTSTSHLYYVPDLSEVTPSGNTDIPLSVTYQTEVNDPQSGTVLSTVDQHTVNLTVYDPPTITANDFNYIDNTNSSLGLTVTPGSFPSGGSEQFAFTLSVTGAGSDWVLTDGTNTITPVHTITAGTDTTQTYIFSGTNAITTLESLQLDSHTTVGTFQFNLSTTVTESDYNSISNPSSQEILTNTFAANSIHQDVALNIDNYITNINNTDFVTITGFTSNTDFYSFDPTSGHEALIGMTGADGSIILSGSEVNGYNGHELYYDNLGGTSTIDMNVNVNQGTSTEVYTFHVDQHTGVLSDVVHVS